jgi:hypothetical protein
VSEPNHPSESSTAPGRQSDGSNPCRICSSRQEPDSRRCEECGVEWPIDTFLGQVLDGDVRIDTVLGRGGMAMVYLATQLRLDREVAVKRLLPSRQVSGRDADWFRQEARVLSQLRHPNLVSVLDFGTADDGSLFLVMEYVRGTSLRQATRGKAVTATRALNLLFQMLAALEEVHRRDIVHRDIKPQNVLIEAVAGEKDFVKLADFGVAHIVGAGSDNGRASLDPSGPVGTPAYMAPEQIRCDPVDHRADIYAAGILLFELLTAALPHGNAGPSQMLIRRASELCDAPSVVRPELPIAPDLDAICLRALAVDPADRYQTAAEFRTDVKRALEDRRAARPRAEADDGAQQGPERPWTVLALRPRVEFRPSSGVRTQVERLMLVWDLVDRYATDHGGVMTAPDGPTGFVLFQDPPNSTAIARAASTALALIHKVSVHFPDTQIACGIARGPVPGFKTGGGAPPEAACLSVARSLARAAGAGRIRLDEAQASRLTAAYQRVRVDGDLEVVSGPGGRGRPSSDVAAADDSGFNLNMRSTLSGRAVAWDRVSEALSSIRANRPGAVFLLTGPAGVGKSELCNNLTTVAAPGTPSVRSEAHPGLDDRPYRPILELIAQMAVPEGERVTRNSVMDGLLVLGVPPDDARVIGGQWESGTQADPWVAMNRDEHGSLPPENLLRALHLASPLERKMAFTSAVSTFARTVAGPSGCVFILEDIDRADEATISAIDGLIHASRQAPVLVVLTARAERMRERVDAVWLEVATLSTDDRIALWASMSPQERDPAITREVLRASEGLPLYLRHASRLGPGSTGSLEEVLGMSLSSLNRADQALLIRAAAIGECFRPAWIAGDEQANRSTLRLLVDWVRPLARAGWWRFVSAALYNVARLRANDEQRLAIRKSAFARMSTDGSCLLPRAITAHRVSDAAAAHVAATELGDRFLVAGSPRRAADWYRIARGAGGGQADVLRLKTGIAEFAGRRNRVACTELASEHFDASPLALVAARTMVRAALSDGDLDTARSVATAALRTGPAPGPQSAELLLLLAEVHVRTDEHQPALRAVETTEKIWQACGDSRPPGLGWRSALAAGRVYQSLGDSGTASKHIVLATRRATDEMDETGLIQCLTHTAAIALREGRGGQLRAVCDNIFGGSPPRQVSHRVLWWRIRGQACGAAGDLEAARECFERASTLASAAGGHVARDLQRRLAEHGEIPNPSRWIKSRDEP